MVTRQHTWARAALWTLAAVVLAVVIGWVALSRQARNTDPPAPTADEPSVRSLRLAAGSKDTLELSPELITSLGVRTTQVRSTGSHDQLNLSGKLFLDSNRMVPVHPRFAGEVVSIGNHEVRPGDGASEVRPLRFGDRVQRGQLLAVIWSKDVGEKKSDLVNALSKQFLADIQVDMLKSLGSDIIAKQKIREAERDREEAIIEVDRVERTLRSWRLTEPEIEIVRREAKKIHEGETNSDLEVDKSWAEVEVRSPFEGVILEKNIVPGDIVDTGMVLFFIADLSVVGVLANVYEEDLPVLESLPPQDRLWTIFLKSQLDAGGIPGRIDVIGNVVNPTDHTAAVMGWLDNPDGRLKAGQFITATIDLPAPRGEVVIPAAALIDDGDQCVVFVAADAASTRVSRRRVALAGRGQDVAYIRSQPNASEILKGCQPLEAGEWVVAAGCIELDGALENVLATMPRRDSSQN